MPDNNTTSLDFQKVKIFQPGIFNGIKTTEADLIDNALFYVDHPNCYADLKITHEGTKKERDEKYKVFENFPFSVGKVISQCYDVDNKALYGDYVNVFPPTKQALNDKLLTTHSAEIYRNVVSKSTGKNYKCVISAVALLPAGEIPALFEVFKPYMYELSGTTEYFDIKEEPFTLDTSEFTYESKTVHVFQGYTEEKKLKDKEENLMNQESYEKKVQKYKDAKMKCMDFEAFDGMEDEKKKEYLSKMEEKFKSMSDKENNSVEPETKPESAKEDFSMDDIREIIKQNKELKKEMFALATQIKDTGKEEISFLKQQINEMNMDKKLSKVETFVLSLIKPEGNNLPKLDPAQKDKAVAFLLSANDAKKEKFSIGSETIEKSQYELAIDFMTSLPEIKQIYSAKGLVKTDDGIVISDSDRIMNDEISDDDIAAQKRTNQEVYNLASKLNIDVDASFENYSLVLDKVLAGQK